MWRDMDWEKPKNTNRWWRSVHRSCSRGGDLEEDWLFRGPSASKTIRITEDFQANVGEESAQLIVLRDEDRERGNENSFCNRTLADDVNYTETDRERFLGFEELQGWRMRERGWGFGMCMIRTTEASVFLWRPCKTLYMQLRHWNLFFQFKILKYNEFFILGKNNCKLSSFPKCVLSSKIAIFVLSCCLLFFLIKHLFQQQKMLIRQHFRIYKRVLKVLKWERENCIIFKLHQKKEKKTNTLKV